MKKEIYFNEEVRKKFLNGVKIIGKCVRTTLGPNGRFVALGSPYPGVSPVVTKDGVSVAKEVDLEDPVENLGVQFMREISMKTNDEAGDGTTTSNVIGTAMTVEGLKIVSAGCRPIEVKRGMDTATEIVTNFIKSKSIEIKTKEQIVSVATISANNDEKIGKLIADAFERVGNEGIVNTEEGRGVETSIDVVEGLSFDEGLISNYFINNKDRAEANFENAYILLTTEKISNATDIIPFLEEAVNSNKPLLIVCDDLVGEALNFVVLNVINRRLQVAAVKTPGFGSKKIENLEDIATMSGATVINEEAGFKLGQCGPECLGTFKSIKVSKNNTVLVGGGANKDVVKKYVESLKKLKDNTKNPKEKEYIEKRIAKFSGSAATITVGAETKTEATELKYRVEDAISATKAALESGIVAGGGYTLLEASKYLETKIKDKDFPTEDRKRGARIVVEALKEPMKAIAENAGYSGEVVIDKCTKESIGFNARTGEYVDLIADGVIDPTKVAVASVVNANSVVGVMLTTDCAIVVTPGTEELVN